MKIAPGQSKSARQTGRSEAVILFVVGNQMFAISAGAVHEIRSTDSLSGSATAISQDRIPKVRQRMRRGAKFLYVVNAGEHFGLPPSKPLLVLVLRGARVAVLADRIERMDSISLLLSLPRTFRGPERTWYRGLTLIDEEIVPVLSPAGFLTEGELSFLDQVSSAADATATQAAAATDTPSEGVAGALPL